MSNFKLGPPPISGKQRVTSLRLWKARGDDRGGGDVGWIWGFRVGGEEEGVVWGRVGGWVEWRRGVEQN